MIKVRNLTKRFGNHVAVNDVSFDVERGEILGFLGPNGAGKSTSIKMITGFLPISSGEISVGNYNVLTNPIQAKRLIGYLPESAPVYPDMTVRGFLKFAGEIRGMSGDALKKAIDRVVGICYLQEVVRQPINTLSKGYRHRTCLAQSIIHDPEVIIMDEPTDGLDPNQKHEIRALIKEMGVNKAVIFSTHILEEVEAVCSRILIIHRGKIVANGTPQELKRLAPNAGAISIELAKGDLNEFKNFLKNHFSEVIETGNTLSIFPDTSHKKDDLVSDRVAEILANSGFHIREILEQNGNMLDVFRMLTIDSDKSS